MPDAAPDTAPPHAGDPVRRAAWLYYAEARTQAEIARETGVSRQTVAAQLAEARAAGLVTVALAPALLSAQRLSAALAARHGLAAVHVVPSAEGEEATRARVGRAGGAVMRALAAEGAAIGVASGRTLAAMAALLPREALPGATVVQVAGSSLAGGDGAPEICAAQIAAALGARCAPLHAPAYLGDAALARRLRADPAIAAQFERIAAARLLVFGIGELTPRTGFAEPPHLTPTVRDAYLGAGAVAVVFGRFLAPDGTEQDGPLAGRTIAIDLPAARRVPRRLALAGGAGKAAAVRAALAAGLATHLVCDDALGEALLGGAG